MNKQSKIKIKETENFVDKKELNLWKRGFTPQAEYGMEGWQLLV